MGPENLGYHAKCLVMSLERKFVKPSPPARAGMDGKAGAIRLETSSSVKRTVAV